MRKTVLPFQIWWEVTLFMSSYSFLDLFILKILLFDRTFLKQKDNNSKQLFEISYLSKSDFYRIPLWCKRRHTILAHIFTKFNIVSEQSAESTITIFSVVMKKETSLLLTAFSNNHMFCLLIIKHMSLG